MSRGDFSRVLARAARNKKFLLKTRRTDWQQRQHSLVWGALLTLVPALGLLPVIGFMLVAPRFSYARPTGAMLLGIFGFCELVGVPRLARCLYGEFDLLGALAFASLVLLLVILMYTGIFIVSFFFAG